MSLRLYYKLWRIWRWTKGVQIVDMERLKSRKLWITILGSLAVTVLVQIGAPESVVENVRWIVVTYLGGQAAVDLMAKRNGG